MARESLVELLGAARSCSELHGAARRPQRTYSMCYSRVVGGP